MPTARAPPTTRVHCGTAVVMSVLRSGAGSTSSCRTPSTISPRSACIFSWAPRSPSNPARVARSGATSANPFVPVEKYSPPGTSPVSNDRPTSFDRMWGRFPSGVIISISTASRQRPSTAGHSSVPCSVSWPFSAWAPIVLHAVKTHPGSHGKKPSALLAKLWRTASAIEWWSYS